MSPIEYERAGMSPAPTFLLREVSPFMKKLASSFLALSMAIILPFNQVQASELTLDSALDQLQYQLAVEWNQQDAAGRKKIVDGFSAQVEELKKTGVSNEAVFKALAARSFDAQTAKDLEAIAKYAKEKKLSEGEARRMIVDYANSSQKLGANFMSDPLTSIAIGLVIAALLVVCLSGGCRASYGCYDDCYIDYWGYYVCDTYCR